MPRLGDASAQAVGKAPQVIGEGHEKDEDICRGGSGLDHRHAHPSLRKRAQRGGYRRTYAPSKEEPSASPALSLKLAHTLDEVRERFGGDTQSLGTEVVAQKVKAFGVRLINIARVADAMIGA